MFRRLWARRFVKISKQTGDGEIVEITFNDPNDQRAIASAERWLRTLHQHMLDRNKQALAGEGGPVRKIK